MATRAMRLGLAALVLAMISSVVVLPGSGPVAAEDRLFRVTVLHFGGGRSATAPIDGAGGVDRFVELVRREHTRAQQVGGDVVIGLGDHFSAGPQFAAARADEGRPLDALALSRVPADAYVIGDDDLRLGTETLGELIDGVVRGDNEPTFVSATVDVGGDPALGARAEAGRIASSTVVTRWGRPIGVVGVTSAAAIATGAVEISSEVVNHTQAEIDRLRDADVDIVILASHLESLRADRDLVARLDGVDLALSGGGDDILADTDAVLAPGDEARVAGMYPLLQQDRGGRYVPVAATGGRYRYLGRLVAWFDGDGEIVRLAPSSAPLVVTATGPSAVGSQRFVGRRVVDETRIRVAAQPVVPLAVSQVELDGVRVAVRTAESNIGNLVADATLAAAVASTRALDRPEPTLALVGSGAIGRDRVVAAGPFTIRDSFDMASDDVILVSGEISPARLRRILEYAVATAEDVSPSWVQVAGLRMEVDLDRPALVLGPDGRVQRGGKRVRSVTLDSGQPIVVDGRPVDGAPVVVAFDETLLRLGHPVGDDHAYTGVTLQQALAVHLTDTLAGAVGARQYPEGGEGRIARPGIPPRP